MRPGEPFVDVVLSRFRERFIAKVVVDTTTGCHVWCGARNPKGYGVVRVARRSFLAHRVSYELFAGPIPEGMQLDHLCRNPSCVNVGHLEPVTPAENTRRGIKWQLTKTSCPQGHPYDSENTGQGSKGERKCRICDRAAKLRYKQRQRQGIAA